MKKPLVLNLFAGAGVGKSTGAAYIFSQLKLKGVNVELVNEFAKDKTWEGNQVALSCQEYIFGEQSYRMARCRDSVDVIVTDCPLLLSSIYNQSEILGKSFDETVLNVFNSYTNLNIFLKRVKPYQPIGRNQTEEEAKEFDRKIEAYLQSNKIPYYELCGVEHEYRIIVIDILDRLGKL